MSFTFVCFSAAIVVASLLGGWLPTTLRLTHLRMQLVLSLVAGVMLGVATIHLIPQAASYLQSIETTMAVVLGGILLMFFLNRIFHFHQHDIISAELEQEHEHEHEHGHGHEAEHEHDHDHGHCAHSPDELSSQDVSAFGLFFGMVVHSLLDGVALGAAVASEPHSHWSATGFSVFLAIALHKPLDAFSITSLMAARGYRPSWITAVNLMFALVTPLGAILFLLGTLSFGNLGWIAGLALALSGGVFLCISLGDLLPELHFHRHDRARLSVALLLGILVAVAIELIPGHSHGGPPASGDSANSPLD